VTVAQDDRRLEYPGNGTATAFTGPRMFDAGMELLVYLVDDTTGDATLQAEPADYTLSRVGLSTSTVTMVVAPPTGTTLLLLRDVDFTQATRFVNQGAFFPELHEEAFDLTVMRDQQIKDMTERALRLPDTAVGASGEISGTLTPLGPVVVSADGLGFEVGSTTMTGDMLLRGNLADGTTPGYGSALTAFTNGGTGAVSRTAQARLRESIHIKDYGDTSTTAGATAALKAAIVRASTAGVPRRILIPHGTLGINEQIIVTRPVQIEAEGGGYYAWTNHAADNISELIWAGGATADPMIVFQDTNFGGGGLSNVLVNGNNLCNGIYFENAVGTENRGLVLYGCVDYGLKLNRYGSN
jgi:hypothetical protein